jgi:hypothetical protein
LMLCLRTSRPKHMRSLKSSWSGRRSGSSSSGIAAASGCYAPKTAVKDSSHEGMQGKMYEKLEKQLEWQAVREQQKQCCCMSRWRVYITIVAVALVSMHGR